MSAPVVLVLVVVLVDAAPPSLDVPLPESEAVPVESAAVPPDPEVAPESEPPAAVSADEPPELEPPVPVESEPLESEPVTALVPFEVVTVVVGALPPAPDSEPSEEVTLPTAVGPSSKKSCCDSPQAAENRQRDSRLHLSCERIVGRIQASLRTEHNAGFRLGVVASEPACQATRGS